MKGSESGCYTDTESLSPGFPEANPRNVLESQENPQNLLRQQEAKIRTWFTLFLVKQNCWFRFFSYYKNFGVDKSHHHLMLINAHNHF